MSLTVAPAFGIAGSVVSWAITLTPKKKLKLKKKRILV
jgi:hypothetical protein